LAELYARYPIQLSAGADTQTFTAAHETIQGLGGNDRILIGTEDQVTLSNWYLGSSHRVEHFQAGGATLEAARVQALVNAMDNYNAPPAEVELSADYAALLQIIGGQWENIG
jgi:hypothetical protein